MPIHPTAIVDKNAEIDPSADIGPYVIIDGPVRVGAGTTVMAHAYLTGWTEIGQNCRIHPAAVIGHEIGHVQAKHGAERVSLNMTSQMVQQAAAIGLQNNANGQMIMAALGVGSQLGVMLPYSRTHESEADYIGLILMAKAGFEPRESVALWQNMAKAGGGNPPEFLSTHPSGKTRIEKLNKDMGEATKVYQKALARGVSPQCRKP